MFVPIIDERILRQQNRNPHSSHMFHVVSNQDYLNYSLHFEKLDLKNIQIQILIFVKVVTSITTPIIKIGPWGPELIWYRDMNGC